MTPVSFTEKERKITLFALLVVFLLSALDMTILSTAMPRIIAELNGIELYAWVTTAYMLTSTVLVPIAGKLGDLYGRKTILVWGIAIFLLGSALSGLSGEFGPMPIIGDGIHQLIVFRAVKGVGGAALFTCVIAIVADMYSPRERAKFMGLFGAVFGISSVIGPAVGGFLTDFASITLFGHDIPGWRWVFYVNLPLGFVSLYLIVRKTPKTNVGTGGNIDYLGAILLIAAFIPFLLVLTWGGHKYDWDSQEIIGMLMGSLVALIAFIFVETKASHPIMPLNLFANKAFTITNLSSFVISMAFLGIIMFMPLYMQIVQGVSATKSGVAMFPLMFGMMFSSIISGRMVSQLGVYKSFMVGGCFVLIAGVYLCTQIGPDTTTLDLAWRIAMVGFGLGPSQGLANLIVQSAVSPKDIGVATSAAQFFRQIGSTIGIALFGTFLTYNLTIELPKHLPKMPGVTSENVQPMDLNQAQSNAMNPEKVRQQIKDRFEKMYLQVDLAYHGDEAALKAVSESHFIPEGLKKAILDVQGKPERELQPQLAALRQMMTRQAEEYSTQMLDGFKKAFSNAITGMFSTALWIVVVGFIITCFIPVISLHTQNVRVPQTASKEEGEDDESDTKNSDNDKDNVSGHSKN
ncbi:MAG: MDR family MFS transporter [Cellvibrionaceae bacterium]